MYPTDMADAWQVISKAAWADVLDARSLPRMTDKGLPSLGKHRPLPSGALNSGVWTRTDAGRALWRLRIVDPEAMGVRVLAVPPRSEIA